MDTMRQSREKLIVGDRQSSLMAGLLPVLDRNGRRQPEFSPTGRPSKGIALQWFRMYAEAVDDDKLRLLAFEDRWHYVALLCLKSQGILDATENKDRRIGVKLGLRVQELDEIKRRLMEVGLVDSDWQPVAWDRRQYTSDSPAYKAEKQRAYRARHGALRNGVVTVTSELPARTDTEQIQKKEKLLSGKPDVLSLNGYKPEAVEILDFLNTKTGHHYKPVPANLRLIAARLKEGATPVECRQVIAKKCREWSVDVKMSQFLRPATLFNATNFAQYQGELGVDHD